MRGYVYETNTHRTIEERTRKEDKETKRERERESGGKRTRESEDEMDEGEGRGLVPYSYPSFARHHVERYTRIGDARVRYCALIYTRARARAYAERTCDSAHEDVSRHRHIWPLYIALMYVVMHY